MVGGRSTNAWDAWGARRANFVEQVEGLLQAHASSRRVLLQAAGLAFVLLPLHLHLLPVQSRWSPRQCHPALLTTEGELSVRCRRRRRAGSARRRARRHTGNPPTKRPGAVPALLHSAQVSLVQRPPRECSKGTLLSVRASMWFAARCSAFWVTQAARPTCAAMLLLPQGPRHPPPAGCAPPLAPDPLVRMHTPTCTLAPRPWRTSPQVLNSMCVWWWGGGVTSSPLPCPASMKNQHALLP